MTRLGRATYLAAGLLLGGCTAGDILNVIGSTDITGAAKSLLQKKTADYAADPEKLLHDAQRMREQFEALLALFRDEIGKEWGADEVLVPTRKRYVNPSVA